MYKDRQQRTKNNYKDEWLKFIKRHRGNVKSLIGRFQKINCRRLWNIHLMNFINLSWKKGEKRKNENFYIWKCAKFQKQQALDRKKAYKFRNCNEIQEKYS